MQSLKKAFGFLAVAALAMACNSVDFKKTKGGVPYKVFENKSGKKIVNGDIVKFHVIQKMKDSVLFNTYTQGMAQYMKVQPVPPSYGNIQGNIMELMPQLKSGDSVYLVQAADSFIKQNPDIVKQIAIKNGDKITTTIRVVDVYKNDAEARKDQEKENYNMFQHSPQVQEQMRKDDKVIEDYLAANHITAQKTGWGTYVQIITQGQGAKPVDGQFSMLRYRGTNLQGQEFDSNTKPGAALLPLQIGAGRSIKGFEEGVRELPKGTKARIFIPSLLGYGAQGSPPRITPFENLVFDIEVADISNTPPMQQPLSQPNADSTQRKK